MNCAWKELLSILPLRLRQQTDIFGKDDGLELRLRLDSPPQLVRKRDLFRMEGSVTADDLHYVINMACRYSPWTAGSAANGYLTAPGGHRIGICGEALMKDGKMGDGIIAILPNYISGSYNTCACFKLNAYLGKIDRLARIRADRGAREAHLDLTCRRSRHSREKHRQKHKYA